MASPCYTIDVCATCGRHAKWPFCAHRSLTESWTRTIVVRPVFKADRDWVSETRETQIQLKQDRELFGNSFEMKDGERIDPRDVHEYVAIYGPSCPDFNCSHEHCAKVRALRKGAQ